MSQGFTTFAGSRTPWVATVEVTDATAADMTILGIPAISGATLHASVLGRSDRASNISDPCRVQLSTANSIDTGNSYLYLAVGESDANKNKTDTAATAVAYIRMGRIPLPAASSTANVAGGGEVWVPAYAGTVFWKHAYTFGGKIESSTTNDSYRLGQSTGIWKNTGAVDGIRVSPLNGNWITGSTLRVVIL